MEETALADVPQLGTDLASQIAELGADPAQLLEHQVLDVGVHRIRLVDSGFRANPPRNC